MSMEKDTNRLLPWYRDPLVRGLLRLAVYLRVGAGLEHVREILSLVTRETAEGLRSPGNARQQVTEREWSRRIEPKPQKSEGKGTLSAGSTPRIMVVDNDRLICQQLERLYTESGHLVVTAGSAEEALGQLEKGEIDLVISEIHLPGMNGIELIKWVQENRPDIPVIVISGSADIETAVDVLKLGASDYIVKPFSVLAIQQSTMAAIEKMRVFMEIRHLRRSFNDEGEFGGMLSKTAEMHRVFEIIRLVAPTDMTVLVEGETGTGKELVANVIHYHSPRRNGPFITINCAAFPETLLESELFGYERGAFTGAEHSRGGKVELAHGGTLFLDEIESISLVMQGKLLRVLENQKVQPLGSSRSIQVDMRVITATNVPLEDLVAEGRMRSDFYYRISVVPIHLIPLRQRSEDIPLLVQDFLHYNPIAIQKGITGISERAMKKLMEYHWPANVRELHNLLVSAVVLATGRVIEEVDVPEVNSRAQAAGRAVSPTLPSSTLPLAQWLREQEKYYLIQQLRTSKGKIGAMAKSSGIDIKTFYNKMRLYGLDKTPLISSQEAKERET